MNRKTQSSDYWKTPETVLCLLLACTLLCSSSVLLAQNPQTETASQAISPARNAVSAKDAVAAKDAVSAKDIITRMNDVLRGTSTISRVEMQIVTPRWKRAMIMDSWSKGLDYYFIHIIAPAREANTTFLKRKRLLHQYIPSAEMRIKISPSMMMQSWMGSDFTNDDLVKESSVVEDYQHTLLGTEKVGNTDCYKIQLLPKPDAPVVWDKIIAWINPENYAPHKQDFFDNRGVRVRTMEFTHFREIDGRVYPMVQKLTPLNKEGHSTTIITRSIRFNIPVDQSIFTVKNLEKPRK